MRKPCLIRRSALAALALLALALALPLPAQVGKVERHGDLHVAPGPGIWTLARVRGPGAFLAAEVTAMGTDAAQLAAYVDVDGRLVWLTGLGAGPARLGGQINSGVGLVYDPGMAGSVRASFGLPEPIVFERELHVYVRIEAGTAERVFGAALTAGAW
ncbi:MAG: hypothetical protein KF823_03620 [Xanthomonadales bacterium]|nr:hypothetical protein [Xanthomonadales bacterium]